MATGHIACYRTGQLINSRHRMMKALPERTIDGILVREFQVYLDGRLYVTTQSFPS